MGRFVLVYGMIGILMGLIMMFLNMLDFFLIGVGMVVVLIIIFYGVIILNMFFLFFVEKLSFINK